jgi:hypothetical protein
MKIHLVPALLGNRKMECICQRPEFRSGGSQRLLVSDSRGRRLEDTDVDLQYYSSSGCGTVSDGYPEVTNFKLRSDERSTRISKNYRKVITNTGRVSIIEAVVQTGNEPSLVMDFYMVVLVLPGGIERTERG